MDGIHQESLKMEDSSWRIKVEKFHHKSLDLLNAFGLEEIEVMVKLIDGKKLWLA